MNGPVFLTIVVEDDLSLEVVRKLLARHAPWEYVESIVTTRNGSGYIKKNINKFNQVANQLPVIVLTDLDSYECAPSLKEQWLHHEASPNLLFRVAIREVEAWLLADTEGIAAYFGIARNTVATAVESLQDPKQEIFRIARRASNRYLENDICPRQGSTASIGRAYNVRMIEFVQSSWDLRRAERNCDSLNRMARAIERFRPVV